MVTTLADHLRKLPDDQLGELLRLRPDLVAPVPADISALAARAQSRVSVAQALDGLDQFHIEVLDALRLSRDANTNLTSLDAVLALATAGEPAGRVSGAGQPHGTGPDPGSLPDLVQQAVTKLRKLALIYGGATALQVVPGVDENLPYLAGLGRPAAQLDSVAARLCADPAQLRRTLLAAPPAARAVLDRLASGPPIGTVTTALTERDSPVRWLVDHGLLVVIPGAHTGYEAVELPREIGLLLRRERGPLGELHPYPPATDAGADRRDMRSVDLAGAGQAMELVRYVEAVLEALAAEPAPVLRAGGLGVRELRRLAKNIGQDEYHSALLVEVAYAAGLIGGDEQFLPAAGYDSWRDAPIAQRWERLARAWLSMSRQPGLVGRPDDRDRPIRSLAPEAQRPGAPVIRLAALRALADLDPGTAPATDALLALLAWQAPRRIRGREEAVREALDEATQLGVIGLGALTSYGRLLVSPPVVNEDDPLGLRDDAEDADYVNGVNGRDEADRVDDLFGVHRGSGIASPVAAALAPLLPPPVDHMLVQADLSVVVPGPPEPALAAELAAVSDPESAGGATVYRVTPQSVRRALDAGHTADDLHALFARRSRTPVPQALKYLIDDEARRHGGLRAGSAGGYLRSDDEALLTEVVADRRLSGLALRRLAPTVVISPYPVSRLLGVLREAGYAPVPEDANGTMVLTRPKVRRAPARPPARLPVAGHGTNQLRVRELPQPRMLAIVEQIRRGDAAARAARRAPSAVRAANGQAVSSLTAVQAHSQALAVLQQAVRDKARVWVGYVDAHGTPASRLVRPVSMGSGYLRAEDERAEVLHTFALHRITAAVPEE